MITYKVIYVSLKSKIVVKFYVHISPVFSYRVRYDNSAFYKIKYPISYFSEGTVTQTPWIRGPA